MRQPNATIIGKRIERIRRINTDFIRFYLLNPFNPLSPEVSGTLRGNTIQLGFLHFSTVSKKVLLISERGVFIQNAYEKPISATRCLAFI